VIWVFLLQMTSLAQNGAPKDSFQVRYVAAGAIYLNGGREEGLSEGLKLTVKRVAPGEPALAAPQIAEVTITAIAAHSAVCEIKSKTTELKVGDTAFLSAEAMETVHLLHSSQATRKYAQVVGFTQGDPLDEEQRDYVPKPPDPEINRLRGRFSYEYNSIRDHAAGGVDSVQHGYVLRADMTRIGGTFWNFTGYYRGRVNSVSRSQETLIDLMNRTYHIGLYYNNPDSVYSAGFGRLYIPWATSLNTIDGGYFARRMSKHTTAGVFAGSTPDPTAWNYNPDRQIAGAFVNFDYGSFESVRLTSTTGLALTRVHWQAERDFAFLENNLSFGRVFSVYHNLEADKLSYGRLGVTESGVVPSRSFLTVRVQPQKWLTLDLNHNYFRGIPTFDSRLLGTGLLDRLLFQGVSAGLRVDLPYRLSAYTNFGQNSRSGDTKQSLNQMYGLTAMSLWKTGIRVDARYSRFGSAFATGAYKSLSFSREIRNKVRLEVQGGKQNFVSSLTQQSRAVWVNSTLDWFLGDHYMVGSGLSVYRGDIQNYEQIFFNLGYRF
jgi:hypothetical protein